MIRGILAKKIGMTQIFDKDGNAIPVSVVEAGPCKILDVIDQPKKKIRIGFGVQKEHRLSKPVLGYLKKIKVGPLRTIREFESEDNSEYKVGQELKADVFKPGEYVDVTGISKGKGFQGGMKRWNWSGGPAGHGSMHHRRVGSIGASADPSRTLRGTNMPGQMGSRRVTVQGLRVMQVDADKNLLLIKGAIPGGVNMTLMVNRSKKRAYRSLDEVKAVVEHKRNPMKQSKAKAGAKKGKK